MRKTIFIILAVVSVMWIKPGPAGAQFFFMENENVGKKVQDFNLELLSGEKSTLEKFRDGKKAIVFFWATWCPHCRVQLGELSDNKAEIEKKGIKVIPVDVGEASGIVGKYMEKNKIDFDVFMDVESEVSENYGIIGVPTFYFIDENGIVTKVDHSLPKDLEAPFSKSDSDA